MDLIRYVPTTIRTMAQPLNVNLSSKGDRIIVTYVSGNRLADVFKNQLEIDSSDRQDRPQVDPESVLQLEHSFPSDPIYPVVLSATASEDFSRFLFVVQNSTETQMRLFDSQFRLLATHTLTHYWTSTGSLQLTRGAFSADQKYVVITYVRTSREPNAPVTSSLRILDATNLSVLVNRTINGKVTSASCFHFSTNDYIAVGITEAIVDNQTLKPGSSASLRMYQSTRDKDGTLDLNLICSIKTPQTPRVQPYVSTESKSALIGVTTGRLIADSHLSMAPSREETQSFIQDDHYNLRMYQFTGKSIHLVGRKAIPMELGDLAFYPTRQFLTVASGFGIGPTDQPRILTTYELTLVFQQKEPQIFLRNCADIIPIPGGQARINFSANGHWMAITGTVTDLSNSAARPNFHLYKVQRLRRPHPMVQKLNPSHHHHHEEREESEGLTQYHPNESQQYQTESIQSHRGPTRPLIIRSSQPKPSPPHPRKEEPRVSEPPISKNPPQPTSNLSVRTGAGTLNLNDIVDSITQGRGNSNQQFKQKLLNQLAESARNGSLMSGPSKINGNMYPNVIRIRIPDPGSDDSDSGSGSDGEPEPRPKAKSAARNPPPKAPREGSSDTLKGNSPSDVTTPKPKPRPDLTPPVPPTPTALPGSNTLPGATKVTPVAPTPTKPLPQPSSNSASSHQDDGEEDDDEDDEDYDEDEDDEDDEDLESVELALK